MKTTVELPDALVDEAREVAEREGTTMHALVEQALRAALAQRNPAKKAFKLRDARSHVKLRPEYEGNWPAIRDEIYRDRGT